MHNAPPAVYPVGRFVWARWVLLLLALSAALAQGLWQISVGASWPQWAWLAWAVCVCAALYTSSSDMASEGLLVWTGEDWLWRDDKGREIQVHLSVLLDSGSALGLVFRTAGEAWPLWHRFAWLQERDMPQMWHGFRCAVYSRSTAERKPDDHTPDSS